MANPNSIDEVVDFTREVESFLPRNVPGFEDSINVILLEKGDITAHQFSSFGFGEENAKTDDEIDIADTYSNGKSLRRNGFVQAGTRPVVDGEGRPLYEVTGKKPRRVVTAEQLADFDLSKVTITPLTEPYFKRRPDHTHPDREREIRSYRASTRPQLPAVGPGNRQIGVYIDEDNLLHRVQGATTREKDDILYLIVNDDRFAGTYSLGKITSRSTKDGVMSISYTGPLTHVHPETLKPIEGSVIQQIIDSHANGSDVQRYKRKESNHKPQTMQRDWALGFRSFGSRYYFNGEGYSGNGATSPMDHEPRSPEVARILNPPTEPERLNGKLAVPQPLADGKRTPSAVSSYAMPLKNGS